MRYIDSTIDTNDLISCSSNQTDLNVIKEEMSDMDACFDILNLNKLI